MERLHRGAADIAASMGPRSRERGNGLLRRSCIVDRQCFNGAALSERGNVPHGAIFHCQRMRFNGAALSERGNHPVRGVAERARVASMGPRSRERGNPSDELGPVLEGGRASMGPRSLSAEITSQIASAIAGASAASMGPRSRERGNGCYPHRIDGAAAMLQWGRALVSAEIVI